MLVTYHHTYHHTYRPLGYTCHLQGILITSRVYLSPAGYTYHQHGILITTLITSRVYLSPVGYTCHLQGILITSRVYLSPAGYTCCSYHVHVYVRCHLLGACIQLHVCIWHTCNWMHATCVVSVGLVRFCVLETT